MILHARPPRSRLPPVVHWQDKRGIYTLASSYGYTCPVIGSTITAPVGFQWDGHSIPRIARLIVQPHELSPVAALYHDLLYRFAGVLPTQFVEPYRAINREEADESYLQIMAHEGVSGWKRAAAYRAVRWFGSRAWGNLPPELSHPRAESWGQAA